MNFKRSIECNKNKIRTILLKEMKEIDNGAMNIFIENIEYIEPEDDYCKIVYKLYNYPNIPNEIMCVRYDSISAFYLNQ